MATAESRRRPRYPYRRHRRIAIGVLVVLVVAVAAGIFLLTRGDDKTAGTPAVQSFHSAPGLHPPPLKVVTSTGAAAPGDLFLAPKRLAPQAGPMITDGAGRLVWFRPVPKGEAANSFAVQRYHGRPVLTWWTGHTDNTGHGIGVYTIADTSYRTIATVRAGNGLQGDLHEFRLTSRGTALITIYRMTRADLRGAKGAKNGKVIDSVVQEVDVKTGKVLFQWNSLRHVPVSESYITPQTKFANSDRGAFDYFHVNSAVVDTDGDLLISGRNVDAVYKVDRHTGKVLWRLGGKRSDFKMGKGSRFAFQHDVERQSDGTITIFDNGSSPKVHPESRVLVLRADPARRTVKLVRAFTHPQPISAMAEGNAQRLPDGHVFVGWGFGGTVSEFTADGKLVFDAKLPAEVESYRAYRFTGWHGRPDTRPAVAASKRGSGMRVYASWNGATEVARWQVLAGRSAKRLKVVGGAARDGYETTVDVKSGGPFVAVRALGAGGARLGASAPVRAR